MYYLLSLLVAVSLLNYATTHSFPPAPNGVTVLQSQFYNNVTISYKQARTRSSLFPLPADLTTDNHLRDDSRGQIIQRLHSPPLGPFRSTTLRHQSLLLVL